MIGFFKDFAEVEITAEETSMLEKLGERAKSCTYRLQDLQQSLQRAPVVEAEAHMPTTSTLDPSKTIFNPDRPDFAAA